MPFVDDRQIRARAQLPGAEYHTETPWWDGYAASLGMVIDEEMSISSGLNREGWRNRHQKIRDLDIDLRPYTDRRGRVDYDTLASEYDLKTDAQLEAERAQMLATRREYAQEVLENAPASAQFLGAMNGYLLDPISIATMPMAYTVKGAQGLSVLSRIGRTAAKAAAIEGATEAAIQGLVFDYKKSIDSPYSAEDAVTAIATAAAGASILGGATEGISGYLKSIRQSVDPETLSRGELKAYESVQRMEDALEGARLDPDRKAAIDAKLAKLFDDMDADLDYGDLSDEMLEVLEKANQHFEMFKGGRGHDSASMAIRENLGDEAANLYDQRVKDLTDLAVRKRMEESRAVIESEAETLREMETSVEAYNSRTLNEEDVRLVEVNTDYRMQHTSPPPEGANTLDDLSDIYPDDVYGAKGLQYYGTGDRAMDVKSLDVIRKFQGSPDAMVTIYRAVPDDVDQINSGDWVSINKGYAELHLKSNIPDGKVVSMEVPARDITTNGDSIHEWGYHPKQQETVGLTDNANTRPTSTVLEDGRAPHAQTASVESDVLARTGLDDAYNQTAAEYAELKNKVIFDGESNISADDLIKEFDDELGGLDNVMRCVRG